MSNTAIAIIIIVILIIMFSIYRYNIYLRYLEESNSSPLANASPQTIAEGALVSAALMDAFAKQKQS